MLDAAIAALNDILDTVQAEIDALLGAVTAVLDGTPLVSFDSLSVLTRSAATTNTDGGQEAVITGGELTGLKVLGTDVLDDVLGTSSVDLLDLVGGTLADVNALVAGLSGTLSSVLSSVRSSRPCRSPHRRSACSARSPAPVSRTASVTPAPP